MSKMRISGFTLVEMMVVIAIIGVVASIAVPSLQSMLANQRLRTASYAVIESTIFARSEAVKRGTEIVIKAPASNDLNGGWCIQLGATEDCSITAPGGAVMRLQPTLEGVNFSFSTTAGPISFNRSGRLAAMVKVQIEDAMTASMKRCVLIDVSGNARTEQGACS